MTMPNIFHVASLFTDILLLLFLHKTIMPTSLKLDTKEINQMVQEKSSCNKAEPEKLTTNRFKSEESSTNILEPANVNSKHSETDEKLANIQVEPQSGTNISDPETQNKNKWYQRIKHWNPMLHYQGPERIPIRVSIMSSLLVFPFLGVHIAINLFKLDAEHRAYVSWMTLAITNTLRCPLTIILAFKSKAKPSVCKKTIKRDLRL